MTDDTAQTSQCSHLVVLVATAAPLCPRALQQYLEEKHLQLIIMSLPMQNSKILQSLIFIVTHSVTFLWVLRVVWVLRIV